MPYRKEGHRAPHHRHDHGRPCTASLREANPIPEAGEFQIGDYGSGGSPGQAGEFKVTLIELANGGRRGLYPHLEVFGDGEAALREAIDAGIVDVLSPVGSREEFARRLIAPTHRCRGLQCF